MKLWLSFIRVSEIHLKKLDEVWRPECLGICWNCSTRLWFLGCVTNEGIGTFTEVSGDINFQKYMNILDTNLRPVIMRHFPNEGYFSPYINIIENVWGTIKKVLKCTDHSKSPSARTWKKCFTAWTL